MGANEKFDAAMHGAEYTPTTAVARGTYEVAWDAVTDPADRKEVRRQARAEFNRWLETLRAEAKAEALNEAADQVSSIDGREDHAARDWLRNRANQMKEEVNGC